MSVGEGGWRQARWREPLVYEIGDPNRLGLVLPYHAEDKAIEEAVGRPEDTVSGKLLRAEPPPIPGLSEVEAARHYNRLAQMSYGVDLGPVPLGSCTMKYNPKVFEKILGSTKVRMLHPLQDEDTVQGILEALFKLERWLAELTGMDKCSLQPPAGAAGELAGALMMRKYHRDRGEDRDEMLVPDSAHGTNPASAAMAGFRVVKIPTGSDGTIDLDALSEAVGEATAGMMLTNPNTLGVFESNILEAARIVHDAGGILYYDGANLNGIMGIVRPGDMGFDIVHLNMHKTFAAPHGGGGPGAGVVCAKGDLVDYLPRPLISFSSEKGYYWDYSCARCIGSVRVFYGNIIPLLKAFLYIASMGGEGLREAALQSVINTNYFMKLISKSPYYTIPYDPGKPRKHEIVISAKPLSKASKNPAMTVAKALLDYGLHAPTVNFPPIVEEALMIEFTESEPKHSIEAYVEALNSIGERIVRGLIRDDTVPRNTSVGKIDEVYANHPRTITPTYRVLRRRREKSREKQSSGQP